MADDFTDAELNELEASVQRLSTTIRQCNDRMDAQLDHLEASLCILAQKVVQLSQKFEGSSSLFGTSSSTLAFDTLYSAPTFGVPSSVPALDTPSAPSSTTGFNTSLFSTSQQPQSQPQQTLLFHQPAPTGFGSGSSVVAPPPSLVQNAPSTTQMAKVAPVPFSLTDRHIQAVVDAYKEEPGNSKYAFKELLFYLAQMEYAFINRIEIVLMLPYKSGINEIPMRLVFDPGAISFCFNLYKYVGIFMVAFAILIFLFRGSVEGFSTSHQPYTYDQTKMCKPAFATALFNTMSFLLGDITSVVSGFLGMQIATYENARTTLEARKGVRKAFINAFRPGSVMGVLLAANGLLVHYIAINLFEIYYGDDWEIFFEAIIGYGLVGFSMALFGRVGGGIYTNAADVDAGLVGNTAMAKKSSMFNDPTAEIPELTTLIKNDPTALNSAFSDLQTIQNMEIADGNYSNDRIIHSRTVCGDFKSKLMGATKQLQDVLTIRTENIKTHENRKHIFSKKASRDNPFQHRPKLGTELPPWSNSLNASESSQQTSPSLLNAVTPSNQLRGRLAADNTSSQQMETAMMQQVVPRQKGYSQSRATALHSVESTITELSGIFTHLATMVAHQEELAMRMDDNMVESSCGVNHELTADFKIIKTINEIERALTNQLSIFIFLCLWGYHSPMWTLRTRSLPMGGGIVTDPGPANERESPTQGYEVEAIRRSQRIKNKMWKLRDLEEE